MSQVTGINVFLRDWAVLVLNTELSLDVPIIYSHQNAPAPSQSDPYLVITYAANSNKFGRPRTPPPDENGETNLVNDYILNIELWEVNGDGGLLVELLNSIDRQNIKDLWNASNYALLSHGSTQHIPALKDNKWTKEAVLELVISTADQKGEDAGLIENIEYTGEIPAQGRAGEHILTNT